MQNKKDMLQADQNCIFCKIISGKVSSKIIYQTDYSIVFQDVAPQAPTHYLIIPKNHIQDLVSCTNLDIMRDLMSIPAILAKQLGEQTSFRLLTNNGYTAGQRVFHLHFHFLSGKNFTE